MINNKILFDIWYLLLLIGRKLFCVVNNFLSNCLSNGIQFFFVLLRFCSLIKSIKAIELTIISYWKCHRWAIRFDFSIFCSEKANSLKCHVLLLGIVAQSAAMDTNASLLNQKNCIHVQSAIISTIHIMM